MTNDRYAYWTTALRAAQRAMKAATTDAEMVKALNRVARARRNLINLAHEEQ